MVSSGQLKPPKSTITMAIKHKYPRFTLALLACSLATLLALASSRPTNLRIQVNNENIHNAPYLLEAIKQIDNAQLQEQAQNNANSSSPPAPSASSSSHPALDGGVATQAAPPPNVTSATDHMKSEGRPDPALPNLTSVPNKPLSNSNRTSGTPAEEDYEDSSEPNSFSSAREETIDEIEDLDPELGSKLTSSSSSSENGPSPSSASGGHSDYSKLSEVASAETHQLADASRPESVGSAAAAAEGPNGSANDNKASIDPAGGGSGAHKHEIRKPQLPVTSSHLKKPAYGSMDDEQLEASSSQRNTDETKVDQSSGPQKSGGAKSLVSPSVLADETQLAPAQKNQQQQQTAKIIKKMPSNLPDTLEPSQVMNGVTNASAVPGIVNKEYGHQTRTRITLGGGYVRDRLPPLVNPASDAYVDNKPEKPITPLEKTRPIQPEGQSQGLDGGSAAENRELEEANKPAPEGGNQTRVKLGKPDSRCPKEGIRTLEHPRACDKYFYCENGLITEYSCPNGLMYGVRDVVLDYCVHRWQADCQDKSIPNPISSPGCRWQYGIFNVQGSPKCSPDYYECTAGRFEVKKCQIDGQIYDDRTKQCRYAEQVGCANEALAEFTCPPDDQANTYWPFPRYFLNERALIHCVNDKPEIVRCTEDERVDPEHLHCVPIAKKQMDGPPSSSKMVN